MSLSSANLLSIRWDTIATSRTLLTLSHSRKHVEYNSIVAGGPHRTLDSAYKYIHYALNAGYRPCDMNATTWRPVPPPHPPRCFSPTYPAASAV